MKKHVLLIALAAGVFATACKKEKEVAGAEDRGLTAGTINTPCTGAFGPVDLPEIISGNRTLSNDTIYLLDGKTWVKDGTLTIEPGTVIRGVKKSTAALASALIITTGAQINAQGTETCPIVFTSNESTPAAGDWGGVVILGENQICVPSGTTAQIEGITSAPATVNYTYGGNLTSDNSGVFSYVRIEYAGAVIIEGNELNGLTLGGVGCGTKLDHVATYYGADDGFEFFGGNVNAKYLLSVANNDDQFDFDFGYDGSLQFLVSIIDPAAAYANNNSNGIESDGGTGTPGSPETVCHTRPVISNMTIVGSETATSSTLLYGARFRVNSHVVFRNSIVYGYPLAGITLESSHSQLANAGLDKDTCRSSTDSSYFFNDVVETTGATEYLNVSPRHSSAVIAANPSNIGLNSPFLTSGMLDYFDPLIEALAPSTTPATLPVRFCGLSPVACSGVFSFNTVTWKGGALDASGAYWLSQDWAQFSGY